MQNKFDNNPLKIFLWKRDDDNNWSSRVYVFGNTRISVNDYNNKNSSVLSKIYGKDWNKKLYPVSDISFKPVKIRGGDDGDYSNDDENIGKSGDVVNIDLGALGLIDDINELVENIPAVGVSNKTKTKTETNKTGNKTYNLIESAYVCNEDTIMDLKKKIQKYLGIPVFTQHLWVEGNTGKLSYSVNINGVISKEMMPMRFQYGKSNIHGIPISIDLYNNKDNIQITAHDEHTILHDAVKNNNIVNIVDLGESFIDGKSGDYIRKLVRDNDVYQLQVIYYSFILIYYPMLTYQAFTDYLQGANIQQLYPFIYPKNLEYIKHQNDIIMKSYNLPESVLKDTKYGNGFLEYTVIKVSNFIRMSVINYRVFIDLFATSPNVPYVSIRDMFGKQPIEITKTHFTFDSTVKTNLKISASGIHMIVKISNEVHMNLFIFDNTAYVMETVWPSGLNYSFDDITHITKVHITPIIKKINAISNTIFTVPTHKIPLPSSSLFKYLDINYSIIWQESATVASFQEFIKLLNEYDKAKILSIRFADGGNIELFFRKGMFNHDSSRIELQINDELDNYYKYLTDSKIKSRWTAIFEETKLTTIQHRYMNIYINVTGIKDTEYNFYTRLIKTLQYSWYESVKNVKGNESNVNDSKIKQSIKSLKQVDPKLYIAKYPNGDPMIYSKLCQKHHQPIISKTKTPGSVKFINYTTGEDLYYNCPNKKFPHLRFMVGRHPDGLCIPCCKIKSIDTANSKKQKQHKLCGNPPHRIFDGVEEDSIDSENKVSSYIIKYGKLIDVGRLGMVPKTSLGLFLYSTVPQLQDSKKNISNFYLYGIKTSSGVNQLVESIANAIDMKSKDVITTILTNIKQYPDKIKYLKYWNSMSKLVEDYTNEFINGNITNRNWNVIFCHLCIIYLDVFPVIFEDHNTVINLVSYFTVDSIESISYPNHKYVILMHNAHRKMWNPIYLVNSKIYIKKGIITSKYFDFGSVVIQKILDVYGYQIKKSLDNNMMKIGNNDNINLITLGVLQDFCNAKNYDILEYFTTRDVQCYGVLIRGVGYIPVDISEIKLTRDVKLATGDIDGSISSARNLYEFAKAYNNWVVDSSVSAGKLNNEADHSLPLVKKITNIYPYIKCDSMLMYGGKCIGIMSGNKNYYIKPISYSNISDIFKSFKRYNDNMTSDFDKHELNMHPLEINKNIVRNYNNLELKYNRDDVLATYKTYIYNIVKIHIMGLMIKNKNVKIRNILISQIKKLHSNPIQLQNTISEKLELQLYKNDENVRNDDLKKISELIFEYNDNIQALLDNLDNTIFNFDKLTLLNLRYIPLSEVKKYLMNIIRKNPDTFKVISNWNKFNLKFVNIIKEIKPVQITSKYLDSIIGLIAEEIKNKYINKNLDSNIEQRVINYFNFKKNDFENINIKFIYTHIRK
jgi:hypothetical protein